MRSDSATVSNLSSEPEASAAASWTENIHRSQAGKVNEGTWPSYRWGCYGLGEWGCETRQVPPHLKGGDSSASKMLQGWCILLNLCIFQNKVENDVRTVFFFFFFFLKNSADWIWLMDFQFFHILVETATSSIPLEFTTYCLYFKLNFLMSMFNLPRDKPRAWKMDCLFYEVVSSGTPKIAWCEAEVQ